MALSVKCRVVFLLVTIMMCQVALSQNQKPNQQSDVKQPEKMSSALGNDKKSDSGHHDDKDNENENDKGRGNVNDKRTNVNSDFDNSNHNSSDSDSSDSAPNNNNNSSAGNDDDNVQQQVSKDAQQSSNNVVQDDFTNNNGQQASNDVRQASNIVQQSNSNSQQFNSNSKVQQSQESIKNAQQSSKIIERSGNNLKQSAGNFQQSHSQWIAGGTNCSCIRELSALKRDLRDEVNQRMALKAALDSYVSELYDIRNMMSGAANSSRIMISPNAAASSTPSVAFSSKLSYNRELKPLDTVIFDTVLTNDGNAYDPDTGKFTAIVTGTYIFHATILSGYNTKVETAIIVNDKEVARIYSGAHDAHGSGSNMAIVDLRSGDSVWVRLLYQGGNHVHGYYSTFSGALLRSEQ